MRHKFGDKNIVFIIELIRNHATTHSILLSLYDKACTLFA